jgi:hypothetical protein
MLEMIQARIDAPADGSSVPQGMVTVSGWALAERGPFERALLVAGAGPGVPARLGAWRPDVGEAFPAITHASASGFETPLDLRTAAPGPVRIALLAALPGAPLEEVAASTVTVAEPVRPRDGARPRAAFTIVKDEPVMLPLWLRYYERFFAADDLFVLSHDTGDGSTEGLAGRCHVVPVHREAAFDHRWLRTVVEDFQAFLLRSYDTVLFAEVDEFVVADPLRYAGLDAYIDALDAPAARCTGFNVVHQEDEPPLRFDEPLLAQRRCWHASLDYSKRLLARTPLQWSQGFHREYRAPDAAPDPDLMLVHLHRIDYDWCLQRHRRSAARDWNEADRSGGAGAQNLIAEAGAFDAWFRRGPDLDAPAELIPTHIRGVL